MPVMADDAAVGAVETLYLCNFRVSVDGDWLCLKELQDAGLPASNAPPSPGYDGTLGWREGIGLWRLNGRWLARRF